MRSVVSTLFLAASAAVVATPALAGTPMPAPGPLVGLGIPALAVLGYAYRRMRKSRGQ